MTDAEKIAELEKLVCELREALKEVKASWAIWLGTPLSKEFLEKIRKTLSLTPSEISEKWVKREVLEKCVEAMDYVVQGRALKSNCINEALILARTELENKNSG